MREMTRDEGRKLFNDSAERNFGISGDEFIRRWERGEYAGQHGKVMRVVMLMPLVSRPSPTD